MPNGVRLLTPAPHTRRRAPRPLTNPIAVRPVVGQGHDQHLPVDHVHGRRSPSASRWARTSAAASASGTVTGRAADGRAAVDAVTGADPADRPRARDAGFGRSG